MPWKITDNGSVFTNEEQPEKLKIPTDPDLFTIERNVKVLYDMSVSVANIARRLGIDQKEVRRILKLKG